MMIVKYFYPIYVFACGFLLNVSCERNIVEENTCQRFLTSQSTSPLVPNLKRNLNVDEDGEFACEIVLQDENLPLQIRFTIHEGLSWLAIRHLHMGLQRQRTVARHLSIMTEISPSSFDFSYRAGLFNIDPTVSNTQTALDNFHNALYGKAALDKKASTADTYNARDEYARLLGQLNRREDATNELLQLLQLRAMDFDSFAQLTKLNASTANENYIKSSALIDDIRHRINALGFNGYSGYSPATTVSNTESRWSPKRFTAMPSETELNSYISRREPFIVSLGSTAQLDSSLGWNTRKWISSTPYSKQYLESLIGPDEEVLVESRLSDSTAASACNEEVENCVVKESIFGFNGDVSRKVVKMQTLMDHNFQSASPIAGNGTTFEHYYLNIQSGTSGEGKYRTPLHKLSADIPPPSVLLSSVWSNITDVTLWMGDTKHGDSKSALHMDATDNLYVVLEGTKQFSVLSPAYALHTRTVAPTYAVSKDGLSFQFNINKFCDYYNKKMARTNSTTQFEIRADGVADIGTGQQSDVTNLSPLVSMCKDDVQYTVSNNHFSTFDSNDLFATTSSTTTDSVNNVPQDSDLDIVRDNLTTFELKAGDMLYLPTGWFHQVTSRQGRHMAVNYWWRALHWKEAVDFESNTSIELFDNLLK